MVREQKKKTTRQVPVSKDVMHQARIAYPGYDDQTALTLYMVDEILSQKELDQEQSKLLNLQRIENTKLKNNLQDIAKEIEDLEQEAEQNDREIERLKQLIDRIKTSNQSRGSDNISTDDIGIIKSNSYIEPVVSRPTPRISHSNKKDDSILKDLDKIVKTNEMKQLDFKLSENLTDVYEGLLDNIIQRTLNK